jgi:hypothetical protein
VPKPPAYGTIPGLLYFAKYGLQVVRYNSGLQSNLTYKGVTTENGKNSTLSDLVFVKVIDN